MRVTPIVLGLTLMVGLVSARADAVSLRDIIELSRGGLSDEVRP